MGSIITLLASKITTGGFWATIFNWLIDIIPSYGWIMILLTLLIKLLLSPLEYLQKATTIDQMKKRQLMQPELDKINKKYGNNQELIQKKTEELNKKYNVNSSAGSGCRNMLLYLLISTLILVSLYSSVGSFSRNIVSNEFASMQKTYTATYNYHKFEEDGVSTTQEYNDFYNTFLEEYVNNYNEETMKDFDTKEAYATSMADAEIVNIAQDAVLNGVTLVGAGEEGQDLTFTGYKDMVEGWLWVKNVWRPDTAKSVFPTADEFISSSGLGFQLVYEYELADPETPDEDCIIEEVDGETVRYKKDAEGNKVVLYTFYYEDMNGKIYYSAEKENEGKLEEEYITEKQARQNAIDAFKLDYDTITGKVFEQYSGANGYYILIAILCVLIILNSKLSHIGLKVKDKKGDEQDVQSAKQGKGMIIFTLVLMVLLAYNRATIFSLYLVTQYLIGIPINIVINKINNKRTDKKEQKHTETIVADYVRR